MSDEPFLQRWSRRKRSESVPENAASASAEVPSEGDRPAPEAEPDPELLASLPRIEDLTPDTDIRAFLDARIPAALRQAALRRAWAVDPVIRDYVGPADYAWDFNAVDTATGFGPLKASDKVAAMVHRIMGGDEPPAPSDTSAATEPGDEVVTLAALAPSPPGEEEGIGADPLAVSAEMESTEKFTSQMVEAEQPPPSSQPGPGHRRRHGGAIPR